MEAFDRSIDIRIMRLRRKIEDDPEKPRTLKTVRGLGYIFATGDAGGPAMTAYERDITDPAFLIADAAQRFRTEPRLERSYRAGHGAGRRGARPLPRLSLPGA